MQLGKEGVGEAVTGSDSLQLARWASKVIASCVCCPHSVTFFVNSYAFPSLPTGYC